VLATEETLLTEELLLRGMAELLGTEIEDGLFPVATAERRSFLPSS
jgi:hypothetical protein